MEWFLVGLALAFVLSVVKARAWGKAARARRKGLEGERRVAGEIARIGVPAIHDAYLRGRNGTTQVDHVARVGNAIVVVETKCLSGAVYGTAADRNWRQSFRRGQGTAFLNPIRQNAIHVAAVRRVAGPAADVWGIVVMARDASFPQGMPPGVVAVGGLAQWMREALVDAGPVGTALPAWAALEAAVGGLQRRRAAADHMETVRRAVRAPRRFPPGEQVDPTL